MDKSKWVWMGHPGHFICASKCRFHLNTYVGGYIVSTVGEYWPERAIREIHAEIHDKDWFAENKALKGDYFDAAYMKRFGFEDIGYKRTYETMVFKAKKKKQQKDGWDCCPYDIDGPAHEFDVAGYKNATDAYKGHMKMCAKWSKK